MKISNTEEFLKKCNSGYDYSKVIYVNSRTKIEIVCPEHGSFFQTPNNHLSKKHTCPSCSLIIKSDKLKYSLEYYLPALNEIHEGKYKYDKFEYTNYSKRSIIICPEHGEFLQSISLHLQGCGCPTCNSSRGEKAINKFLTDNDIKFETEKRFDGCRYKRRLPFDFYLPEYNLCIEYDGTHHYGIVNKNYEYDANVIKIRDDIKTNFCTDTGIRLLRIPFYEFENISEILIKELNLIIS